MLMLILKSSGMKGVYNMGVYQRLGVMEMDDIVALKNLIHFFRYTAVCICTSK